MANVGPGRIYQDFEPTTRWTSEPGVDILVVDLPGFHKDQLRIVVTQTRKLRLTGERPTGGNKWIRFRREISLPSNIDADSISAMFKDNKLYVRHPKIKEQKPQTKAPTPPKPQVEKPRNQPNTKQGNDSKPMVEENKPEKQKVERKNGGKTDQLNPNAEDKAREVKDAKAPLSAKDEEKDMDGAKWLGKYREATRSMVKEAKNKRQTLCNLVAVLMLVLLILLYARNAAWSSLKGKSEE